jgi:hypothetical protein
MNVTRVPPKKQVSSSSHNTIQPARPAEKPAATQAAAPSAPAAPVAERKAAAPAEQAAARQRVGRVEPEIRTRVADTLEARKPDASALDLLKAGMELDVPHVHTSLMPEANAPPKAGSAPVRTSLMPEANVPPKAGHAPAAQPRRPPAGAPPTGAHRPAPKAVPKPHVKTSWMPEARLPSSSASSASSASSGAAAAARTGSPQVSRGSAAPVSSSATPAGIMSPAAAARNATDAAKVALKEANAARARMDAAQEKLDAAQARFDQAGSFGKLAAGAALAVAKGEFATARDASLSADAKAQMAVDTALRQQNRVNADATAQGRPVPYPHTPTNVRTAAELARLPAADQVRILGGTVDPRLGRADQALDQRNVEKALEQKAAEDRAVVDAAAAEVEEAIAAAKEDPGNADKAMEALDTLEDQLRDVPEHLRGAVMDRIEDDLGDLADPLRRLSPDDTRRAMDHLADAADLVGPAHVGQLTNGLAKAIADKKFEGESGIGPLQVTNHDDENELLDALKDVRGSDGGDLLARSLARDLVSHGDPGFADAVATGGDAPSAGNLFTDAVDLVESGLGLVGKATQATVDFVGDLAEEAQEQLARLGNVAGDAIRGGIADAVQVDQRVNELDKGDTFTIGLGANVGAAGIEGGAAAQLEVEHTADGKYRVTVEGEASAGVFAVLGSTGVGNVDLSAGGLGRVSVTAEFDSKEEAIEAARNLAGVGIAAAAGTALAGPILGGAAAVVTGASAGEELQGFRDNISTVRVDLGAYGEVGAELGLPDAFGANGSARAEATVGVEFRPGEPPQLVVEQQLELSGSVSAGNVPIGADGVLPSVSGSVNAEVSLETRVPLPGNLSLDDIARDPLEALKRGGQESLRGATTTVSAGVTVESSTVTAGGGVEVGLEATVPTSQLGDVAGDLARGDIAAAARTLDAQTDIQLTVDTFEDRGPEVDLDFKIGVGPVAVTVGIEGEFRVRDRTNQLDLQGTPSDVLEQAGDLLSILGVALA